jgi:hypothetical protein
MRTKKLDRGALSKKWKLKRQKTTQGHDMEQNNNNNNTTDEEVGPWCRVFFFFFFLFVDCLRVQRRNLCRLRQRRGGDLPRRAG